MKRALDNDVLEQNRKRLDRRRSDKAAKAELLKNKEDTLKKPLSITLANYGIKITVTPRAERAPKSESADESTPAPKHAEAPKDAAAQPEADPNIPKDNKESIKTCREPMLYTRSPERTPWERLSQHQIEHSKFRAFSSIPLEAEPDPMKERLVYYYDMSTYKSSRYRAPEILHTGITPSGTRCMVRIEGFDPYFYVGIPQGWLDDVPPEMHNQFAETFHAFMAGTMHDFLLSNPRHAARYGSKTRVAYGDEDKIGHVVLPMTRQEKDAGALLETVHDVFGFRGKGVHVPCVKFRFADPGLVPFARKFFWHPYGTALDFCYLCKSLDPNTPGRCTPFLDESVAPESVERMLRERHQNVEFSRKKRKKEDDTGKPKKKTAKTKPEILYGVERSVFNPSETYFVREQQIGFEKFALVKHHSKCPARFHATCLKQASRAFRVLYPFKHLDDKYFARCPVCFSDFIHISPAFFVKPRRNVVHTQHRVQSADTGQQSDEEDLYDDIEDILAEGLSESDSDDDQEGGAVRARRPYIKPPVSVMSQNPEDDDEMHKEVLPAWCVQWRKLCTRFTRDKKLLSNATPTELMMLSDSHEYERHGLVGTYATMTVYEGDVPFDQRFIIDKQFLPASYLMVPAGCYQVIPWDQRGRVSTLHLEFSCHHEDMRTLASAYPDSMPEEQRPADYNRMIMTMKKYPVMEALCYDIETLGLDDLGFPHPLTNRIIQLIAIVMRVDSKKMRGVLFSLGGLSENPPPAYDCPVTVMTYEPDQTLLELDAERAWDDAERRMLQDIAEMDAVLRFSRHVAHNASFDAPFFVLRCRKLGVHIGRMWGSRQLYRETSWREGRSGKKTNMQIKPPGTIYWDTMLIAMDFLQLNTYGLGVVAKSVLGMSKNEMPYSIIPILWRTKEGRARLARYTVKDGVLLPLILFKLKSASFFRVLCEYMCCPEETILYSGTEASIIAENRFGAEQNKRDFGVEVTACVVPTKRLLLEDEKADPSDKVIGYEAAHVETPVMRAYLNQNLFVCDFAALYPHVMMWQRHCHSNLVPRFIRERLGMTEGRDFKQLPQRSYERYFDSRGKICYNITERANIEFPAFVTEEVQRGIVPAKLEKLKMLRNYYKKLMGDTKDAITLLKREGKTEDAQGRTIAYLEELVDIYDLIQQAIKRLMNSKYGLYGQNRLRGRWSLNDLAYAVTAVGKHSIISAKNVIETAVSRDNGFPFDVFVDYIDTDSTFGKAVEDEQETEFNFGYSIPMAFMLMNYCGQLVTDHFQGKLSMTPEKVYTRGFLIVRPKMYCGNHVESARSYMEAKGLSVVRRDFMTIVKRVGRELLEIIVMQRDYEQALERSKHWLTQIYLDRIPLNQVSCSGSYKRRLLDESASLNKAGAAAYKHYLRTGIEIPHSTRITYVIVLGEHTVVTTRGVTTRQKPVTSRAELLSYATEQQLSYDPDNVAMALKKALSKFMVVMVMSMHQMDYYHACNWLFDVWNRHIASVRRRHIVPDDNPIRKLAGTLNHWKQRCVLCRALIDTEASTRAAYLQSRKIAYEVDRPAHVVERVPGGVRVCMRHPQLALYIKQRRPEMLLVTNADAVEHGASLCSACAATRHAHGSRANVEVKRNEQDLSEYTRKCVDSFSRCRICSEGTVKGNNGVEVCTADDCDVNGERAKAIQILSETYVTSKWLRYT